MVVLASGSPRRREMLERLGIVVRVAPADIDETPLLGEAAVEYARRLANAKAMAVCSSEFPLVIGADTIVECDGQILGKPADADDALAMLQLLLGRSHRVTTAFALVCSHCEPICKAVTTEVVMRDAPQKEQMDYVAAGEWRGKAGGYAIQGMAAGFVTQVKGSVTNVIGLPLAEVLGALAGCGVVPCYQRGISA